MVKIIIECRENIVKLARNKDVTGILWEMNKLDGIMSEISTQKLTDVYQKKYKKSPFSKNTLSINDDKHLNSNYNDAYVKWLESFIKA